MIYQLEIDTHITIKIVVAVANAIPTIIFTIILIGIYILINKKQHATIKQKIKILQHPPMSFMNQKICLNLMILR